jgi:hypothetical protein
MFIAINVYECEGENQKYNLKIRACSVKGVEKALTG